MALYRVTFKDGRVGRTRGLEPQEFEAEDADGLAEAVYRFARRYLASQYPSVGVDLEEGRGWIDAGRAASFSVEEATPA